MSHSQLFSALSLFQGLNHKDVQRISRLTKPAQAQEGELIFKAGDPPDALYVLLEGLVKLELQGRKKIVMDTLGPGDFFGEMELIDGETRAATASCLSDCSFLKLPREEFLGVVELHPTIATHVLKRLSAQVRQAEHILRDSRTRELDANVIQAAVAAAPPVSARPKVAELDLFGSNEQSLSSTVPADPATTHHPGHLDPLRIRQIADFLDDRVPLHKFLGVRVEALQPGYAVVRLPWRPEFVGDPAKGALHGGLLGVLVDAAGGAACFTRLDKIEERLVTIDLRVDFLKPIIRQDILCEGRVLRVGNRVASARVEIFAGALPEEGSSTRLQPFATGQAVYNVVRSTAHSTRSKA